MPSLPTMAAQSDAHDYRVTTAIAGDAGVSEWLEETKPQVWRKRCGFFKVVGASHSCITSLF